MLYKDAVPGISWYIVVLLPAQLQVDHLGSKSSLYGAVIAIATVTVLVASTCLVLLLIFRNTRLMKLTKPLLTGIVISGVLLLGVYCYLLLGENNNFSCAIRPWLFNLAFTLSFSPLLIKAYTVHRLFNVNPMAKHKIIHTTTLILYTCAFLVVDAIVVAVTAYVGGKGTTAITTTELTSNGAFAQVTYCSTTKNKVFLYCEIVFKGLLVGAACVLAFLVRKIHGVVAGSRALLVVVYNVAIIGGAILLISHSMTDVELVILCQVVGISVSAIIAVAMLVVPNIVHLATVGDDHAADDVITGMFRHPTSGSARHPSPRSSLVAVPAVGGLGSVFSIVVKAPPAVRGKIVDVDKVHFTFTSNLARACKPPCHSFFDFIASKVSL